MAPLSGHAAGGGAGGGAAGQRQGRHATSDRWAQRAFVPAVKIPDMRLLNGTWSWRSGRLRVQRQGEPRSYDCDSVLT